MTAIYAGSWSGGETSGTTDRSASGTPAVGELLVVACQASTNTNTAPTCTDDQGGTYTLIFTAASNSSADMGSVFVRNQPVATAVAHNVTVATGSNAASEIGVIRVSGMSKFGITAVRSKGKQENQATSTTPAPVLDLTPLTTNVQIAGIFSADTTTTPPASWTERVEASQITPTCALEIATRDSGNTTATITFGAAENTAFASFAIELDCSAPAFTGSYPTGASTMNAACGGGTWSAAWLFNETSGNAAPTFGSGNLTATGVTYSNTGMLSGETALGLDGTSDSLNGGNIYDLGASSDLVFVAVVKFTTRGNYVVGKRAGNAQPGWDLIDGSTVLTFEMDVTGPTGDSSPTVPYSGSNEWAIVMGAREIGVGHTLAIYSPSGGYSVGVGTTPTADQTNTSSLIVGPVFGGTTMALFQIDALYLGVGSGAASGMGTAANLLTRLRSFVDYVAVAQAASTANLLLLGVG